MSDFGYKKETVGNKLTLFPTAGRHKRKERCYAKYFNFNLYAITKYLFLISFRRYIYPKSNFRKELN